MFAFGFESWAFYWVSRVAFSSRLKVPRLLRAPRTRMKYSWPATVAHDTELWRLPPPPQPLSPEAMHVPVMVLGAVQVPVKTAINVSNDDLKQVEAVNVAPVPVVLYHTPKSFFVNRLQIRETLLGEMVRVVVSAYRCYWYKLLLDLKYRLPEKTNVLL
jgi:hypothetical protein